MERKRLHSADDLDPDYEDVADQRNKRQRQLEHDAKQVTTKKIEAIVRQQFTQELQYKENEVDVIDQRLYKARIKLDRLRACLVASYYSTATQTASQKKPGQEQTVTIHPAVKQHLGKAPIVVTNDPIAGDQTDLPVTPPVATEADALPGARNEKEKIGAKRKEHKDVVEALPPQIDEPQSWGYGGRGLFKEKRRIIIGNVSRYIMTEKRDAADRATHKWMVYVRGSKKHPDVSSFIKKVWFFLHPSYSPNDLVEVSQEPFHLIRRGWGEFPVRVQLHFLDPRNKRVDVIHHLKLDKTYTGLQTLGAETVVDLELEGASINPTPSTSRHFPETAAPLLDVDSIKKEGLPPSDNDDTVVEASCVVVKKEISSADVAVSAVNNTVSHTTTPNLISPQVVVKREPASPVKDATQRNGFVAGAPRTSPHNVSAIDTNYFSSYHAMVTHDTPLAPSIGEVILAASLDISQNRETKPEDATMLTAQWCERCRPVTAATCVSSPQMDWCDTSDILSQTASGDTASTSSSTQSDGHTGGHYNSAQVKDRSSVVSERDRCLPQATTTSYNTATCVTKVTTSTCVSDMSSISATSPVGVMTVINTTEDHSKIHAIVNYNDSTQTSSSRPLITSHDAVDSLQTCGESLLQPQLLSGQTSSPEQLFVKVVDQSGCTYLIPRTATLATTVSRVKPAESATVVVVKKQSLGHPTARSSSSESVIRHRQVGHRVATEMATPMLTPRVSLSAVAQRSYSLLTQRPALSTSRSSGAISLLKPCIPTSAVGVPRSTIAVSSTLMPRFSTVVSAAKQTITIPAPVATPGGSVATETKLYLAKVGNRTVMIKVEPKCKSAVDKHESHRDPGGKDGQLSKAMLRLPGGHCSDNAPYPVKEGRKPDVKDSPEEAAKSTSGRIADFVQSISLTDYNSIEQLVRAAMTHFPLWKRPLADKGSVIIKKAILTDVSEGTTQNLSEVTIKSVSQGVSQVNTDTCCTDFLQWNIGKQRAAEWLHARLVRRALMAAIDGQTEFKGQQLWTTRKVMTWCRYHGYTPLDKATQRILQQVSHRHVGPRKFDSYTDCRDLQTLIEGASLNGTMEEPDIDVVNLDAKSEKSASPAAKVAIAVSSEMVAPPAEVKFIQQMAEQIGVHFGPVELSPGPAPCTYTGVTEILVWTAVKTFTEHLLRSAVCSYYKREPIEDNEVTVADICDALTRTECFDFLTNRYMAVTLDDQTLATTVTADMM